MRLILAGHSRCGTTITARHLNKDDRIQMLNEARLYYPTVYKNANEYFSFIKKVLQSSRGC